MAAIDQALEKARAVEEAPTFIRLRTTIGYGAPSVEGTSKAHGSPLGEEALATMRANLGWPSTEFFVPEEVRSAARSLATRGAAMHQQWAAAYSEWAALHPALAQDFPFDRVPPLPDGAGISMTGATVSAGVATRQASGAALNALAPEYPALVGGSADLEASTNTAIPGGDVRRGDFRGRTIRFGIREHAMAAVMNGMSAHGGVRPFGSTFLVFADYMRPALRLSALMRQPVIYVLTHDSVHVGEDGPTHQPIEHIESLRIIPGLTVLRPADASETALAWDIAVRNLSGPTALVLTRQALPALGDHGLADLTERGFRTIRVAGTEREAGPDVILAASGSEVSLALAAAELLIERGVRAAVISVMWRERLEEGLFRDRSVLPDVPVVWIEAGVTIGWRAIGRDRDRVVGLNRFGESGPGARVAAHLGLTPAAVANAALRALGKNTYRDE